MLRKAFDVAPVSQHGAVVSARVYSSGLGWNEMTLNGEKTQPKGHMNPGFTEYNDTVQYTVEDVTRLISASFAWASTSTSSEVLQAAGIPISPASIISAAARRAWRAR